MESDSYRPSRYQPGSPRERAVASALSLGVIVLIVLALVFSAIVNVPDRIKRVAMTSFSMDSENPEKAARSQRARPKAPHVASRQRETTTTRPKPIITIQKQVERPDAEDGIPGFIKLSSADMAASDIGRMKGKSKGSDSNGTGADARTAYGPGEGPGGVRLYDAEWYRKPTDAQLATYMPQNGGLEGWGLIACQTIDHYHVDNCQILGESPRGSGFGRAVQNAAWQFLVLPPRINSKPQVGEWVRIRIDYSVKKGEAEG